MTSSSYNTHVIEITGTRAGLLSAYPTVRFFDAFFFKNVDFKSTFTYPTTTYGGTLTAGNYPDPVPENWDGGVTFTSVVSGGTIKNYTYEDFSALVTSLSIGNYFCTPVLLFSFSSYDESVSPVKKITWEYQNKVSSLSPKISATKKIVPLSGDEFEIIDISTVLKPKNQLIRLDCIPDPQYIKLETVYLSVFKMDNTINKFSIFFNIIQCGLLETFGTSSLINSQILDSSDKILLTIENKETNNVYNTILNTDIPFYLLTGGDVIQLSLDSFEPGEIFDLEASTTPGETIFLVDQIRQIALEPQEPLPDPNINIVNPNLAEYYYRGERGIRVRPLITRLLPREEFYYEIPSSGMILTSGGAPYIRGRGIRMNLEFRTV